MSNVSGATWTKQNRKTDQGMPAPVDPDVILAGMTAKDLLIAVGWLFTILGWFVSNTQANRPERRKEVRAEMDACIKLLAELLIKSRVYFCSSPSDTSAKPRAAESIRLIMFNTQGGGTLARMEPPQRISHESIYSAIYALPKGELSTGTRVKSPRLQKYARGGRLSNSRI